MKNIKILCGVSGAGKSTKCRKLLASLTDDAGAVVCSADQYFLHDGEYQFDPSKLDEAHGHCLRKFTQSCQTGLELIVVDNTNTTIAELAPYAALGLAYGYDVEIIIIKCDPVVAYERNVHGVPQRTVVAQMERLASLRQQLPPWWKVVEVEQ